MKKTLKKMDHDNFENLLKQIGKSLIGSMYALGIPNYIKTTFETDGSRYELMFKKLQEPDNIKKYVNLKGRLTKVYSEDIKLSELAEFKKDFEDLLLTHRLKFIYDENNDAETAG